MNQATVLDQEEEIIGQAKAQEDLEAVEEMEEVAVAVETMEETFKAILLEALVDAEVTPAVVETISTMGTIR